MNARTRPESQHDATMTDPLVSRVVDAGGIAALVFGFRPFRLPGFEARDTSILVVVEDVSDLWALERAAVLKTHYHVLGGVLSPLDGIGPDDLNLDRLVARASDPAVREVILALNATVDGQTTAHFITDLLHHLPVKVTRLAHGVPVGGELDYLDEGTLSAAIRQRTEL